jgi:hypothetical protein
MANELYRFTDPGDASISIEFDSGEVIDGVPTIVQTDQGPRDGFVLAVPLGLTGGVVLTVEREGYVTFSNRAIFWPNPDGPAGLDIDDIRLVELPEPEQPPQPAPGPPSNKPLDIINWVYAGGTGQTFNLYMKQGCGEFTEACCRELHQRNNAHFGHIKKRPEQNQWNGHAVDAISCLSGEEYGVWDIIYSSESSQAKPVYNHAGDPVPEEWYYVEPNGV